MSTKDDSGRLLSKMAKFVRNPLRDWTELDAQDSITAENGGYSREMLKDMIERRQRNDFVRRREFDLLRKLRQREAAGARDPGQSSSLSVSSTSGKSEGRAQTLRKIDEIEAQMSKQWWKGDPADDGASVHPEVLAAQRARAYADTTPGLPPDHDLASAPAPAPSLQGAVGPQEPSAASSSPLLVYDSALDEASIRFAHGDDAGAESILLQALVHDGAHADHGDTWLALLDLYRAMGDSEKFVAASTRYAQRLKRRGPEWVSLRALARGAQPPAAAATAGQGGADWRSPAQLRRADLGDLTRALSAAGAAWTLDWRLLTSIDPDATGPLRVLFTHWADSAVDLRFIGAARLEAVLEQATPVNDRDNGEFWWQLRMAALRVMHAVDPFELAALNYCITYEVSPPAWEEPRGQYASLDPSALLMAGAAAFSLVGDLAGEQDPALRGVVLSGELSGESHSTWKRLDAEIADAELAEAPSPATIGCAALLRVDLAAAGTLLAWVTARDEAGQRVQFVETHRLIAAFFRVVGIADHAVVNVRQD